MRVAATTLLVLWFEVARLVLVSVTKAAELLLRAGEATTGVPTASKKRRLSAAGYPLQRAPALQYPTPVSYTHLTLPTILLV